MSIVLPTLLDLGFLFLEGLEKLEGLDFLLPKLRDLPSLGLESLRFDRLLPKLRDLPSLGLESLLLGR
ncbi:hypothetical protein HOH11_00160, partial [Candidatus Woesearchaeota archaeon]|nr:hypothetical protein [Candidatus Woesearchaeota archaeon]